MAKSIRSKKMRKNRAEIRKTLSAPLVAKRTEALSQSLQEEIKARASSAGLSHLKKLLTPAAGKVVATSSTVSESSKVAAASKATKGK